MADKKPTDIEGPSDIRMMIEYLKSIQDESEGQYMTTAAIYNKIKGMAGSSLGVRGISKFGQFLANLDGIVRKRTKVGTMYLVKPL
ncbi:MAG: DUF3874 domain-containing protein [Prevotella sp.]|nr:DUF3874 domain-containing protein [Prevotella sp.]